MQGGIRRNKHDLLPRYNKNGEVLLEGKSGLVGGGGSRFRLTTPMKKAVVYVLMLCSVYVLIQMTGVVERTTENPLALSSGTTTTTTTTTSGGGGVVGNKVAVEDTPNMVSPKQHAQGEVVLEEELTAGSTNSGSTNSGNDVKAVKQGAAGDKKKEKEKEVEEPRFKKSQGELNKQKDAQQQAAARVAGGE